MTKPAVDTAWATESIALLVPDGAGGTEVAINKAEPSTSYKQNGVAWGKPVIGNYVNYWQNAVHQTLEWMITGDVGWVLEYADSAGVTAIQIMADRGGTWVDQGTYTKAGLLTRVFVKTA